MCYTSVGCLGLPSVPESPSPQPNPYLSRVRICSLCKAMRTNSWSPRLALRHRQMPGTDHQRIPCTGHPRMPYNGLLAVMVFLYSSSPSSSGSRKRITTGCGGTSALAPHHNAVCWWSQEDLNCNSGVISVKGTPQTTSTA
ncbi:hypothetical protein MRX96_013631 [Rhipicephalus microplus]